MPNLLRVLVILPLVAFLAGCSDSSAADDDLAEDDSDGCRIRGSVAGALRGTFDGADLACLLPFSSHEGIDVVFAHPAPAVESLDLRIVGTKEKETGTFTAQITVKAPDDGPRYTTKTCSVTLDSNEFLADHADGAIKTREYRVKGSGTCPDAATDSSGASVQIAAFSFVFSSMWQ